MAFINYNGTELQASQINSVGPVIQLANPMNEIKYCFEIVLSHSVMKSVEYDTQTDADNARTVFLSSL